MDRPDRQREDTEQSDAPAGGWGSLAGIASILAEERPSLGVLDTLRAPEQAARAHVHLLRLGKAGGPPCLRVLRERRQGDDLGADPRPRRPGLLRRPHADASFAAGPTTTSRNPGRLTHPLRYDAATDRYVAGRLGGGFRRDRRRADGARSEARRCSTPRAAPASKPPTCTRCSPGSTAHNNLPDSSNMCHETHVGRRCQKVIGVAGRHRACSTTSSSCDCIFFFGQNTGIEQPALAAPRCRTRCERGVPIVTFNPAARERPARLRQSAEPARDADRRATRDHRSTTR